MAEWSKAPDSSLIKLIRCVFWSANAGVGSNPTAVKFFLTANIKNISLIKIKKSKPEILNVSIFYLINLNSSYGIRKKKQLDFLYLRKFYSK